MRPNRTRALLAALILALAAALLLGGVALAGTPAENLRQLDVHVSAALAKLQAGDVAGARLEFKAFNDGWFDIEDGVKGQSKDLYRQIEDRMVDVQAAFAAQPLDPSRVQSALHALQQTDRTFIEQYGGPAPSSAAATAGQPAPATAPAAGSADQPTASAPSATAPAAGQPAVTAAAQPADFPAAMAASLQHLDRAQERIAAGDANGAAASLRSFIAGWPNVEGPVATRAPSTYRDVENKMAQAAGLLASQPPRLDQASSLIGEIHAELLPFAQAPVRYGAFDAAIILLREGFEALLIVGALLAFLKRSGNAAKQIWIWWGGAVGVAASAVVAVVVNLAFAQAGGPSRELLEGSTGLVAAGMLVWMMFWLHGKANVATWNRYIRERSQRALARNSLLSLALIAFLAVFREGAETVLFYVGIAPAIGTADLLIGLSVGAAALLAVAVLMLLVGVRIPIRPFFLATSALVFFLAFKFVGMGVHSIQVAGRLTAHAAPVPFVELLGIFPTWETTLAQLALLGVVATGLAVTTATGEGGWLRAPRPVRGDDAVGAAWPYRRRPG